jgi:protein TonB
MLGESRPPTTNVAHGLPSNVKREGSVLSPAAKRDLQGYQRRIYEAVSRAPNRYPPAALRLGLEGKGKILVRIDRQGRIVSKKILQSTGHQMLDDKAMQTIEEVAPFGPLPDTFELPEVEFVIPVTFRLTDG